MELKELLAELVEFLKALAPEVWATGVRQVYASAASTGVAILALMIIAGFVGYGVRIAMEKSDKDPDCIGWAFGGGLILIVLFVVIVVLIAQVVPTLINPNYYAIQHLINIVK